MSTSIGLCKIESCTALIGGSNKNLGEQSGNLDSEKSNLDPYARGVCGTSKVGALLHRVKGTHAALPALDSNPRESPASSALLGPCCSVESYVLLCSVHKPGSAC
jgi:hypothetical protein